MEEKLNTRSLTKETQKKVWRLNRLLTARMHDRLRMSGESEINHPRRILNMMVADSIRDEALLLAALAHDAIEDGYMNADEIEACCGVEARRLVEGETKLSNKIEREPDVREAKNLTNWIVAAHAELRVPVLKAYDNLDNWRDKPIFLTISGKEGKPYEHALETLFTYALMMDAFGCWWLRVRLEDEALVYYDRDYSKNIKAYRAAVNYGYRRVEGVVEGIRQVLAANNIEATVTHQVRHYSEVFRKCQKRDVSMEALLKALPLYLHYISIVLEGKSESLVACHTARGVVDVSGQITPRTVDLNNLSEARQHGYRALHTRGVIPRLGEIMIGYTTASFDRVNRFGLIAQGIDFKFCQGWAEQDPVWLARLHDVVRRGGLTAEEIRQTIPKIVFSIPVFSPSGEETRVSADATVIDYAIMTDHDSIGRVFVNGEAVAYSQQLVHGDIVTVEAGEQPLYHPVWLLVVHDPAAAAKIRSCVRDRSLRELMSMGEEALNAVLSQLYLTWNDIKDSTQIARFFRSFLSNNQAQFLALIRQNVIHRSDIYGVRLIQLLAGLGELDIERFARKFRLIYEQDLLERVEHHRNKIGFAIEALVYNDAPGLQAQIEQGLATIGVSIFKNSNYVKPDGTARLAYVFRIHSNLQRVQIKRHFEQFLKDKGVIVRLLKIDGEELEKDEPCERCLERGVEISML